MVAQIRIQSRSGRHCSANSSALGTGGSGRPVRISAGVVSGVTGRSGGADRLSAAANPEATPSTTSSPATTPKNTRGPRSPPSRGIRTRRYSAPKAPAASSASDFTTISAP